MLKKAVAWGEKGKAQITKDSIQFLNRMGEKLIEKMTRSRKFRS